MNTIIEESSTDLGELKRINRELSEEVNKQNHQIDYLNERIELLLAQLYAKKSEQKPVLDDPDQISYLDPLPEPVVEENPVEKLTVSSHQRKTPGRKPLPAELPRVEEIHDIPEDEKQCECGNPLTRIGEEISEQLDYEPAKLQVTRHIRPKYACKACEGVDSEGKAVRIAPPPKQIIPRSIASAGLLAQIITAKFVDAMPFYRQEKQFGRLGYELSRTNMANWSIHSGDRIEKLLGLLRQEILSGPLIHMDETGVQVLKEPGRSPTSKSYMWVMRTGASEKPGVYFEYSPSRASSVAQRLLESYRGIVQSDGYAGYDFIDQDEKMQHAGCWAHARRKFIEVLKAKGKYQKQKAKQGYAGEALDYIGQLYLLEREANDQQLSAKEKEAFRQKKSKPLLETLLAKLQKLETETPPKGLLGKAIHYTLSRWQQLTLYLGHGSVPLDNNLAENAIRPFVVGRKNWLFCDTVNGAVASARLYSLIETAKANKLNPYEYLKFLFEQLPYADSEDELRSLLPQHIKMPATKENIQVG